MQKEKRLKMMTKKNLKWLSKHSRTTCNENIDRVEFLRKEQSKDESFEDYLLNLKSSSKDCEWNDITDNDMIKL